MLALVPITGANAVIMIRFGLVRHSIKAYMAPIARIMPAFATARRRIVSIMDRIARLMDKRGPVTTRTGPVVDRIASVKCRFRLNMGRVGVVHDPTLLVKRRAVSAMPPTMLVM